MEATPTNGSSRFARRSPFIAPALAVTAPHRVYVALLSSPDCAISSLAHAGGFGRRRLTPDCPLYRAFVSCRGSR